MNAPHPAEHIVLNEDEKKSGHYSHEIIMISIPYIPTGMLYILMRDVFLLLAAYCSIHLSLESHMLRIKRLLMQVLSLC